MWRIGFAIIALQDLFVSTCIFLPAVKPTGHKTVRVVTVVAVGDYFEVMTSKVKVNLFFLKAKLLFFCLRSPYPIL